MRIIRANIFGFGKWVDETFEFNETSPIVIYGDNESGKSTFHQFILFMLFGMQPKKRKFYESKTSSKLGGHLVIEDSKVGRFTIERFHDKRNGQAICITESGEMKDEAWLREKLHGIDENTYEAIFSFSAMELNEIEDMGGEDVGNVLLSIGLTGSSNIQRIEKGLAAQLDKLFKPNGRNPNINQQLQILQQLADELATIQEEEAVYYNMTTESTNLRAGLKQWQENRQKLEEETQSINKLLTGYPIIVEYQHLLTKKDEFKNDVPFPANGIERFEKMKEALRPLISEYKVLENNLKRYENNLTELENERLNESTFAKLQELYEKGKYCRELEKNLQQLREKQTDLQQLIIKELDDLQINFRKEDLSELNLPFYIEEIWKELKEANHRLTDEEINLQMEKNVLQEEEHHLKRELNALENALLPEEKIAEMRGRLEQERENAQFERLYETTMRQKNDFVIQKNRQKKLVNYFLFGSILLALLVTGIAFFQDNPMLYIFAIIFFIIGFGQFFAVKQHINTMEKLMETPPGLSIKEKLSQDEIDELKRQLQREEEKKEQIKYIEKDLQNLQIRWLKWEEKKRTFDEKMKKFHHQIEEQILLYPFLEAIDVKYWSDYFRRLRNLLDLHGDDQKISEKINELKKEVHQIEREITSFVGTLTERNMSSIEDVHQVMEEFLEKEYRIEQQKNQLLELIDELEPDLALLAEQIHVQEMEIKGLFQQVEAKSEEEFYNIYNYVTERGNWLEELKKLENQLSTLYPDDAWKSFAKESINEIELNKRKSVIEKELKQADEKIETIRMELAEVDAELKRMEGSELFSEKMHQFEMEKEKLNEMAKEWAITKMQKEILLETKQRYQDKYLSKVIEATTDYFQSITDERFSAVYLPDEAEPFQVMTKDGLRFTINELSQGTINQLYVSLRLAISKVMTETTRFPFILDDAFVHFDERRTKRMMEILQKIGEEQQVIIFTCKLDVRLACEQLGIPVTKI